MSDAWEIAENIVSVISVSAAPNMYVVAEAYLALRARHQILREALTAIAKGNTFPDLMQERARAALLAADKP